MKEGDKILSEQSEHSFSRPPDDTDKLYMNIGEGDVIEVAHPIVAASHQSVGYARKM